MAGDNYTLEARLTEADWQTVFDRLVEDGDDAALAIAADLAEQVGLRGVVA